MYTRMMSRLLDGSITLPNAIYIDIPLKDYPDQTRMVCGCPKCNLPDYDGICIDSTLGMEQTLIIKCQCGIYYQSYG